MYGVGAPNQELRYGLRFHRRVWSRIVIQQQNDIFEKPRTVLLNNFFQFPQSITVQRSIDGSNLQKVHAKVSTSSVFKALSFPAGFF
ncbi:hypothetical protein TNCV_4965231 [Trichonephila clavipes]|nr:hypothetical protein TNCV_4965231 [Trichonephila clavipes]